MTIPQAREEGLTPCQWCYSPQARYERHAEENQSQSQELDPYRTVWLDPHNTAFCGFPRCRRLGAIKLRSALQIAQEMRCRPCRACRPIRGEAAYRQYMAAVQENEDPDPWARAVDPPGAASASSAAANPWTDPAILYGDAAPKATGSFSTAAIQAQVPKAYLVAPEHFNELDEQSSEALSTRTEDVFPEDDSTVSEPAASAPEAEHGETELPEGAEWQVVHLNQHVYTACFSAKCSQCSASSEESTLAQALFWGYRICPRCAPTWCINAPPPRIRDIDQTRTAQSSSASGPLVSSSQTVLGSWLHIDDAVVATSHPEETLQATAAAANPLDHQVDNLESTASPAAENIPDPESDTPRTTIHYSDVD